MSAALWFLLGATAALLATGAYLNYLMQQRNRAARTRTFQTLAEAQAWARQMQDAGYDPFFRYEVRCYRRTKDTHA